jgi:hypothetical protein
LIKDGEIREWASDIDGGPITAGSPIETQEAQRERASIIGRPRSL